MVIVNKKPHFKEDPLLIFQLPSPPTLNNWLSHLKEVHIFLYAINFLLCLLIFVFLLIFFSSHKATWSRRMAAAAHFGLFQRLFRPYRPISVAVSAGIGMFRWPYQFLFSPKSARFGPNRRESGWVDANPKKKKKESRLVRRRIGFWCGDLGAASVLSRDILI